MGDSQAEVALREVTRETLPLILELKVSPDQAPYVASNAVSIAEAYFWPGVAWFRAIYADETPVGFLMLEEDTAAGEYSLWRLMVDARYQRRGYGRRALDLVFNHVRTRPGGTALLTSCVPGEDGPGRFYEQMGFVYTGDEEDGELVMRRDL